MDPWAKANPQNCEVCGVNRAVEVSAVPGVPASEARCTDCITAGAHSYWILVVGTANCGGLERTMEFWRIMVTETLDWLGKSRDEFDADVEMVLERTYDISS